MTNSSLLSQRVSSSQCWCFLSCRYSIVDLLAWKENAVGQRGILVCPFGLWMGHKSLRSWCLVLYIGGIWGASVYVYDGLLAIWAKEQFLLLQVLVSKDLWTMTWTMEPLDVPPLRNDASHPLVLSRPAALSNATLNSNVEHWYFALLSHIKVSETGRGRPSVLQLTCQACLQHVSSLNDFSFSTKPTVNCPEMCLSSHEILLSSHSFLSMKCGSRNQNLLSSFVAWRGVFFSLARCVCQDWPTW